MKTSELKEILDQLWHREITVDEAWGAIDQDRERPSEYDCDYWLPLVDDEDYGR